MKMEEVRSVAEYIECLKGYQRSGLCGYRPEVRYYYRGESRDYGRTSGQAMIGRGNWLEGHNEAKLFRECERRLTDEFLDCKSTFEKLVMMQHYGIPTRILDISLDPLVALFFALYLDPRGRKDDSGDGIVLVYEVPENSIKNYREKTLYPVNLSFPGSFSLIHPFHRADVFPEPPTVVVEVEESSLRGVKLVARRVKVKVLHRIFHRRLDALVFRLKVERSVLEHDVFAFRHVHQLHLWRHFAFPVRRKPHTVTFRKRNSPAADSSRRLVDERHNLSASSSFPGMLSKIPQIVS